nr:hypothetical protein [Actinoplanes ferrugineus]
MHEVERLRGDQWLVPPLVLLASVLDEAEVVAVAEKVPQRVDRDRSAGGEALGAEASVGESLDKRVEAVGATRVQLECRSDEWAAYRVDGDRADLPTLECLTDVEVADWCPADRAASDDLLAHLVGDVGAGSARLVLVHAVEHGRDQITDGAVLGVIHDRDQDDARAAEIAFRDGGVDAVAV